MGYRINNHCGTSNKALNIQIGLQSVVDRGDEERKRGGSPYVLFTCSWRLCYGYSLKPPKERLIATLCRSCYAFREFDAAISVSVKMHQLQTMNRNI
jgi:hypothetical protein